MTSSIQASNTAVQKPAFTPAATSLQSNASDPAPFSRYMVLETDFWTAVFERAKNGDSAYEIVQLMEEILDEPCCEESDRVYRCVLTANQIARKTLSLH